MIANAETLKQTIQPTNGFFLELRLVAITPNIKGHNAPPIDSAILILRPLRTKLY